MPNTPCARFGNIDDFEAGVSRGRVLVTGANGFVGRALMSALRDGGLDFRAAVRSADRRPPAAEFVAVGDLGPRTDWRNALAGVDRVVHLAGRAHVRSPGDDDAFQRVNAEGTAGLARAAAAAGVRRFILLSTVGVHGARSPKDRPLTEESPIAPVGPYARSKWEGEESLRAIAGASGMEWVALRPPLVYGPGAPGNFARLLRWARSGFPIPLGALTARRSFVFVGNLASAVLRALQHPRAANRPFLVSDGADLSTGDLLRALRAAGVPLRLVSIPAGPLRLLARWVGRAGEFGKLADPLELDIGAIRRALEWRPPWTVTEGLARSVRPESFGGK